MAKIRVLIADDYKPVLDTVSRLLACKFEIVGATSDGAITLDEVERLQPDVLVTDISMPGLNGIEIVRRLTRVNSVVKVVLLTVHENDDYVSESLAAGAAGYVVKTKMASDLVEAIEAAHAGGRFVSILAAP